MSEQVVVIDYGAGNLCSVDNALRVAAGGMAGGGATITVSSSPAAIRRADRIVLPGVGAFGQCIGALRAASGIAEALTTAVKDRGVPFLGICVGMQLLASEGREHGIFPGLNWIGGAVERLTPALPALGEPALKVPHMGWNTVAFARDHPALADVPRGARAYFVHSYRFVVDDPADVVAATDHGGPIAAIVARDNLLGVQFHPEKSQSFGLGVLRGFLRWRP